jgi:hypothetical protein
MWEAIKELEAGLTNVRTGHHHQGMGHRQWGPPGTRAQVAQRAQPCMCLHHAVKNRLGVVWSLDF